MDTLIDYFVRHDGRIFCLTFLGLLTLLPLGVIFCFIRRLRYLGWVFLAVFLPFGLVSSHELAVHLMGGRPWSPLYELLLDSFVPSPKKIVLESFPFTADHYEFEIAHSRRGKHGFKMWTNQYQPNCSQIQPMIYLDFKFVDRSGKVVFEGKSRELNVNGVWNVSRYAKHKGSETTFVMYKTPKDVPLDEPLKCIVDFSGDVALFRRNYPNLQFTIEKEPEW